MAAVQDRPQDMLAEHLQHLPTHLKRYVTDRGYREPLRRIAIQCGMHEEGIDLLEQEVLLVLIGITDRAGFSRALSTECGLSFELAQVVATEIDREVFERNLAAEELEGQSLQVAGEASGTVPVRLASGNGGNTVHPASPSYGGTDPYHEPVR